MAIQCEKLGALMIPLLRLQYLKTHLSPWNVLDTYAFAEQYGEVHILYQCLRLIDKNAGYVFASPGFTCLPMRLVKALAARTTLSAREVLHTRVLSHAYWVHFIPFKIIPSD